MKRALVVLILLLCLPSCNGSNPTAPDPTPTPTPTPAPSISPGQHLVGSEVQPGRYYTDPAAGCFWQRLSGVGGTEAEIIARRLATWDAGQLIVDILASDFAFSTNAACGTWTTNPPHGAQTGIPAGMWLVGAQVPSGTYRTNAGAGCFWERLSGFSGAGAESLAGGGVAGAGPLEVVIEATDAGFNVDDECGTWTRISGVAGPGR